jgi:hypothetical protein
MKTIIFLTLCALPILAISQETTVKFKKGNSIHGTITQYIPASIKVKTDSGEITIPVKDLTYETITNFPNSFSEPYKANHEVNIFLKKHLLEWEQNKQKDIEDSIAMSNALQQVTALQAKFNKPRSNFAGLQVIDMNAKASKDTDEYVSVSWKVTINNTLSDGGRIRDVIFRFLDRDHYLLEDSKAYKCLFPTGISEVTGKTLMKTQRWNDIGFFDVILEN